MSHLFRYFQRNSRNYVARKLFTRKLTKFLYHHLLPISQTRYCSTRPECGRKSPKFQSCTISDSMIDPCNPEPSVVIVGAGVAGLSAAQRLAHCGIGNFTVLEATDRPGGRIHSCWVGDVVAELGAEEIRGSCIGNPMFNLAVQGGLIKTPLPTVDKNKRVFCTSDGRAIDTKVSSLVVHMFQQLQQEASSLFSVACGKNHGSLFQFLSIRIQQELLKLPEDLRYDAARIMYGMLNHLKIDFGECLSNVSADNYGSYIHIPGGHVQIPLGLVGVLAPLLRELPECSVKFGKPVGLIRWGALTEKGPRAIVQCCDGDEYCADYVIVTVSLGVLKAHADKLFCPTLPANKMEAIKKLGTPKEIKSKILFRHSRSN